MTEHNTTKAGERTQHTPGPWTYDPESHEIESGFGLVATLANEGKGVPQDDEGNANARLIAAAPDLLQACKNLEAELQAAFDDVPAGVDAWMALARAAIAKAEGRKA